MEAPVAPLWGELRYGGELARLLAENALASFPLRRRSRHRSAPVMLIPGFMAGDSSLTVMRAWLRRHGHPVSMSGMRLNAGCAEEIVSRLQEQLWSFAARCEEPVVLIGQSRGGALARSLAVREPENVSALVMLGSPVSDPLAVSPQVLRTVRLMAALGDLGVPRLFSSGCADGECCESFWADLEAPLRGAHRGGVGLLAQRRHRRLERVRGSARAQRRGLLQPLRHVGAPGRVPRARRSCSPLQAGR